MTPSIDELMIRPFALNKTFEEQVKERTYRKFLENVNEDFIFLVLLVVKFGNGLLDGCRRDSALLEYFGDTRNLLLLLRFRLD